MWTTSSLFLQQPEVIVSRKPCRFQIVEDDWHRHFLVSGNDNGSGDAGFGVGSMATLLSDEMEP